MTQQRADDCRRYVLTTPDGRILANGSVRTLSYVKAVLQAGKVPVVELKVRPETFIELLRSAGL